MIPKHQYFQIPPTLTDYRGHRRPIVPVREINLGAYADMILTQIASPALGIEPKLIYMQRFHPPRTVLSLIDRA